MQDFNFLSCSEDTEKNCFNLCLHMFSCSLQSLSLYTTSPVLSYAILYNIKGTIKKHKKCLNKIHTGAQAAERGRQQVGEILLMGEH